MCFSLLFSAASLVFGATTGLPAELREKALSDAVKNGLKESPSVKAATEEALLEVYLSHLRTTEKEKLSVSALELRARYDRYPLVRLHHLMMRENHPRRGELTKRLKTKEVFDALVREFSDDSSAPFAGDTDFRGLGQLPPAFYEPALKMKIGQVTGPIEEAGATHWIQLVAVKPFEQAFAPYLIFLQKQLEQEKLENLLKQRFSSR